MSLILLLCAVLETVRYAIANAPYTINEKYLRGKKPQSRGEHRGREEEMKRVYFNFHLGFRIAISRLYIRLHSD